MDIDSFYDNYGEIFLIKQQRQEEKEQRKAEEALATPDESHVSGKIQTFKDALARKAVGKVIKASDPGLQKITALARINMLYGGSKRSTEQTQSPSGEDSLPDADKGDYMSFSPKKASFSRFTVDLDM